MSISGGRPFPKVQCCRELLFFCRSSVLLSGTTEALARDVDYVHPDYPRTHDDIEAGRPFAALTIFIDSFISRVNNKTSSKGVYMSL